MLNTNLLLFGLQYCCFAGDSMLIILRLLPWTKDNTEESMLDDTKESIPFINQFRRRHHGQDPPPAGPHQHHLPL
jgi:hypothetical protein